MCRYFVPSMAEYGKRCQGFLRVAWRYLNANCNRRGPTVTTLQKRIAKPEVGRQRRNRYKPRSRNIMQDQLISANSSGEIEGEWRVIRIGEPCLNGLTTVCNRMREHAVKFFRSGGHIPIAIKFTAGHRRYFPYERYVLYCLAVTLVAAALRPEKYI